MLQASHVYDLERCAFHRVNNTLASRGARGSNTKHLQDNIVELCPASSSQTHMRVLAVDVTRHHLQDGILEALFADGSLVAVLAGGSPSEAAVLMGGMPGESSSSFLCLSDYARRQALRVPVPTLTGTCHVHNSNWFWQPTITRRHENRCKFLQHS